MLRHEAQNALREENGWNKSTTSRLKKLDSVMKESQRFNTSTPISLKRIVEEPITLSDGLQLPKGAYICVVNTSQVELDDEFRTTEPDAFDGLRYYQKRLEPASRSRYQYSATDKDHISFGHGRYACPGRFVAAVEMKMILAHTLLNYDLKFIGENGARPQSLKFLELSFQNPAARILIKRELSPAHKI